MDGPHLNAARTSRTCWRWAAPVRPGASISCLILAVIGLLWSQASWSADRPGLLQRLNFRGRSKASSSPEVPPSPEKQTAFTDPNSDIVTPYQSIDPSDRRIMDVSNGTNSLQRFPDKSMSAKLGSDRLSGDLMLDVDEATTPIDLPTALQLAGWKSPEVLRAQQQVLAVTARQQLAAAQALPNLNLGGNFDSHTGALQQSTGAIIEVQRSALYVGAGGNAVGAGQVNIPGLQYNMNVGEAYFAYLTSRQQSERSLAAAVATRNNVLLQIAIAYCQLVRAQGTRAIAVQVRDEALEIARITASFAKVGQGLPADAERAKTEVGRRDADIYSANAAIIEASARLGEILNLESSVRLQTSENWTIPRSIVPDLIPLPELIAISLYQRPEVAERRAEVHAAMLQLNGAQLLLFSPQFIADFSDGAFGGGSTGTTSIPGSPSFGDFGDRTDTDLIMYWSIRNLGLANHALIKTATARLAAVNWERTQRFNEIRAEVTDAYARTQSYSGQLTVRHRAVISSENGLQQDMQRAKAGEGRPIEVLDSLRLRSRAQQEYLDTIANYNQAQYELYVAIGQPPADLLIHTNPPTVPPSPIGESK